MSQRLLSFLSVFALVSNFGLSEQILHKGNGAEPKDLDPHLTTGVPEFHILINLFDGLTGKDPKTLEPTPGAAESWKISKDGKTYTFKLRKDGKWSNGDPVTAKDFIYSWTRLLKPETAAEYAHQGYYIKNGQAFNKGKIKDPKQLGLKAIDDHTLEVQLENPTPFFLGLTYHHSLYPVHQSTVEKHGAKWTRPGNMVGNGAFMLDRWETNKILTVKPNPHHWDRATVKLAEVHFHPIENTDTEEKMFRAKKLHITETLPTEKVPVWQKDTSGVYQQHPYLGTYFYWVNVLKKPLDNKLVRQALTLAVDRTKIVKFITKGGQLPGTTFTPPGTAGYQPTPRLPADGSQVEKAKELLAKAGYPGGKGFPPMEILYNTNDGHKKIAEAIQQMWKETLGIDVRLFNQEWKVYLDNQRNGNFQLSRAGWIGDYNDPNTFLDMLGTGIETNHSSWSNKEFDSLIAQAAKERNLQKRLTYFQKAEDILLEELPVIPLYIYTRVYLKSQEVEGWHPNIEDIHPLKFVSLSAKS